MIPTSISKVKNSLQENENLKKENKKLKKELKNLQNIVDAIEDKELKTLLPYKKTLTFKTIVAEIIARDPSNWYKSIWIDKGLNDGVKKNQAVISDKGVVGKIILVKTYSSQILLLTDTSSKISATVKKTKDHGIIIGTLGKEAVMEYINTNAKVTIGQKVVTSGFSNIFPKGLLVGKITSTHRGNKQNDFLKVGVSFEIDFSKLENVLVVVK
jgi:rod shape-determining protein MreC